ncbi:nicotinate phosphoribosyltransferase [Microbacterium sp. 77mftsu3.1]|uniref:nicotinate phosphoribosyltransferase n=1 Tax=Microbacterium sp. 77mftsu3.1 TaxID=1761802 RepID=UPI00036412E3|nr:nicotinate phosphoribosyltransferase [Microbacterium sp. 77mftsu3.1]SDH42853.1 nicotinamide phosphoribosyltransferase [Microbacterium sp. 77mftsu3.1]
MALTTASPIAPLLHTDAYKVDHRRQYPDGVTRVYSNYTNRGSRIEGIDKVVHFGLQAFLQSYCIEAFVPFFAAAEDEVADLYADAMVGVLAANGEAIGAEHIVALHRLGYLPLRFCAVPEGTRVPLRVPSFTMENTLDEFFWVTNFVETVVSASVWHPSTVATLAYRYREILDAAAEKTGDDKAGVDFQLHDFSYRGQVGTDAAAASGAGHLLSFKGSDTLPALDFVRRYYPGENGLVLASVAATEHSVMCAGGQDDELETYSRLLDLYPSGIVSIVSDTWDLWNVITSILPQLHERIMARDGKLVIRPDSGDPVTILTGTDVENPTTPADKGVIELLWDEFGGTVNEAGYKVLDPHIGAIYGDSITTERAIAITERLEAKGFAASNVVFGVGSFSYQYQTRDTFGSAIKATWVEVEGESRNIQKNPITDNGLKKSATGRLAVLRDEQGELVLVQGATPEQEAASELQPVWENGKFLRTQSFADVRAVLGAI